MRTILVLAAVLLSLAVGAAAQSRQRPDGFLSLKWGASRAEVIDALRGQGVPISEEEEPGSPTVLTAAGGQFAGQEALAWKIDLHGGKFYAASVTLKPPAGAGALYREFKKQLLAKYGPTTSEKRLGNSAEERRLRLAQGYASGSVKRGTAASWKFKPTLQDKDLLCIRCEMVAPEGYDTEDDEIMVVTLHYVNETRQAAAEKAAKAIPGAEAGEDGAAKEEAGQKPGKGLKVEDL